MITSKRGACLHKKFTKLQKNVPFLFLGSLQEDYFMKTYHLRVIILMVVKEEEWLQKEVTS